MKSVWMMSAAVSVLMLAACGNQSDNANKDAEPTSIEKISGPELGSFGIDLSAGKPDVAPGADFFAYANGTWLDTFEIPADRDNYGAFTVLAERSEERIRAIIEELAGVESAVGTPEQMVGDYYKSWMNAELVDSKGIGPLQADLDAINAIADKSDLARHFGHASWVDGSTPIATGVGINRLNPDAYQLTMWASGLGLPDRDYYLEDTEKYMSVRTAYEAHIAEMLGFTGMSGEEASAAAQAIMALETKIAGHHWPRADRRNSDKTLNPTKFDELSEKYPGFDWEAFFEGVGTDVEELNVQHPSAVEALVGLVAETDLESWKHYLTFHLVSGNAFLLSNEIDTANFNFRGKTLNGRPEQRARWKRGVSLVGGQESLGEALGQVYVKRHFPESAKAQMDELVTNLGRALEERINDLEWMSAETKTKALAKLGTFNPKIGYPVKWKSYDGINIKADDLFGNYRQLKTFFGKFDLERLKNKTDRDEWFMTPQTVNAYYNPTFNEIVFPAAILQPPFFDPHADPAVNYGGIGAVIGHEMGHGFDDQGSKFDADGVQRNWWTDEDRANFEARTKVLVEQYNGFEALPDSFVDGAFTLGENIGDVGGLSMAYHAYKLSLGGKEAPVIDGLTGDQRFFLAWAQVWQRKYRDEALLNRLTSDPHSPAQFRVNGVVRNMDAWYEAFGVTEDDPLYLAPEKRVTIW